MQPKIRISQSVQELLCCPICHAKLKQAGEQFECTNSDCATCFPIVEGIPVLLNERASLFSINDLVSHRKTPYSNNSENKLKNIIETLLPKIGKN